MYGTQYPDQPVSTLHTFSINRFSWYPIKRMDRFSLTSNRKNAEKLTYATQLHNLSYTGIHLGSSVCHPVCHPVILSVVVAER
jgi:hypothetical protein